MTEAQQFAQHDADNLTLRQFDNYVGSTGQQMPYAQAVAIGASEDMLASGVLMGLLTTMGVKPRIINPNLPPDNQPVAPTPTPAPAPPPLPDNGGVQKT